MVPLAVMGLGATVVLVLATVFLIRAWWSTPIPVLGMGGAPTQPIAFPHTVHVDSANIECEFCHRNVAKGDAATVPAVEQCLFCHATIVGIDNPEIEKLLRHAAEGSAIDWRRVHRLPDHVQFSHEPHIRFFSQQQDMPVGQVCSLCHGDVRTMTEVKQSRSLKMGDCVNCHKDNDAPTDCTTCHY